MRFLVIGELNPDLILRDYHTFPRLGCEVLVEDLSLTLGSASAICAAGLARLGNAVRFAGKVGADQWGDFCTGFLSGAGIDVSHVKRDPGAKTGLTVSLTCAADRALVTYLGAIRSFSAEDLDGAVMDDCTHLHISSYFLQDGLRPGCRSLFAQAHARGLTTSLDPGFDPSERWDGGLREVLEQVDVFLPNEIELRGVGRSEDFLECLRTLDNGRTLTVAKLGADGCLSLDRGTPLNVPAFSIAPIAPVDTTGAGDSFNAGFLHAWCRGHLLPHAMRFAVACGTLSTRSMGGTASQATAEEAATLFQSQETP